MHGDGKSSSNKGWLMCMQGLADGGYNFYSLSMPGYGQSTGKQSAFRSNGCDVVLQVMNLLCLEKVVLLGRSVGGRTAIQLSNLQAKRIIGLVLQHPVVPEEGQVKGISQPVLLSWAKDDGQWYNS